MYKKLFFLLSLLLSCAAFAQQDFVKFVSDYYRVDPFAGKFSAFVKAVASDRHLLNKKATQSGDRYELLGQYKVFNPFGTNANHIQMSLRSEGSTSYFDVATPMYVYEITARFDDSPYARKKLKKDFWLISNRFRWLYIRDRFVFGEQRPLRKKDLQDNGDASTFWFKGYPYQSAAHISWQELPSSNEIEMKISARFAVINNQAYPLGHYPGRIVDEHYDLVARAK